MPTRKWLGVLLLIAAFVGVLTIVGTLKGVPSQVQRPADDQAASFADEYLLDQLNTAAESPDAAGGDRVTQVEALLQSMTGQRVTGSYETLVVGPRKANRFPVAVYSYWEDKSFSGSPNGAHFGRACRIYTVEDGSVTSEPVDCPTSTPEQPARVTLTTEDWPLS